MDTNNDKLYTVSQQSTTIGSDHVTTTTTTARTAEVEGAIGVKLEAPSTPPLAPEEARECSKLPIKKREYDVVQEQRYQLSDINKPDNLCLDEVDKMVCHEDFGCLLKLAAKLKKLREHIATASNSNSSTFQLQQQQHPLLEYQKNESSLGATDVIIVVNRIKQQHVKRGYNKLAELPTIQRGQCPPVDSIMEDSFIALQKEVDKCNDWITMEKQVQKQRLDDHHMLSLTPIGQQCYHEQSNQQQSVDYNNSKIPNTNASGNSIAVKYSKYQTDILTEWMLSHMDNPYPNEQDYKELCDITGLTEKQVVNWTTNVRKRNIRATIEEKKKPHGYIDFCALAHDREKRAKSSAMSAPSFDSTERNVSGQSVASSNASQNTFADPIFPKETTSVSSPAFSIGVAAVPSTHRRGTTDDNTTFAVQNAHSQFGKKRKRIAQSHFPRMVRQKELRRTVEYHIPSYSRQQYGQQRLEQQSPTTYYKHHTTGPSGTSSMNSRINGEFAMPLITESITTSSHSLDMFPRYWPNREQKINDMGCLIGFEDSDLSLDFDVFTDDDDIKNIELEPISKDIFDEVPVADFEINDQGEAEEITRNKNSRFDATSANVSGEEEEFMDNIEKMIFLEAV